MARKAKKHFHRMPPLSFLDKLIYWTIFLLLASTWAGLMVLVFYWRYQIAFADDMVIASGDHASLLWFLVPWMTWFLMTFILWVQPYQDKKPIFGRRNLKYGPPAWPRVYPLFMRNRPREWVSERKQKQKKGIAMVLALVLLISFIPFPWSLYGRDCLRSDATIVEYNMFGIQTEEFTAGDIAEIEIETFRYSTGKHGRTRYGVEMVFRTKSGEKYTFAHRDFRRGGHSEIPYWLDAMLKIKQQYSSHIIHYDDTETLNRVMGDQHLSPEAIEALRLLFDLS